MRQRPKARSARLLFRSSLHDDAAPCSPHDALRNLLYNKKSLLLLLLTGILALCAVASVSCGAKQVALRSVLAAFGLGKGDAYEIHVVQARIPRTVFGMIAGAALAMSGGLMQALTRNPIADPSILGVNTGASLFVVCGISFLHIHSGVQYIWLAFAGASLTAVCVYGLASVGYGGATPMKLALAGAAASTALQSLVNTVMLPDSQVMDSFRFWQIGSIGGATWVDIGLLWPFLLIGFVFCLLLGAPLNTLALGDDVAAGLGLNVKLVRGMAALAGVLLCASTTALAGPIGFIGLMVPHFMRLLVGPDMRWTLPLSAIGGAALMLLSDVLGRLLGSPGEVEVGVMTAILGAPVFILIVRKAKVNAL